MCGRNLKLINRYLGVPTPKPRKRKVRETKSIVKLKRVLDAVVLVLVRGRYLYRGV
jgi:hypothetical protein